MDAKTKMVGFILFISLALTALAESPPVDDSADCVPVTPKPPLCPENEERRCRNPCPPETCIILYAAFLCIQNQTCVDGCYCKEGFLRVGQKGPCVPRDECNPIECVNDPNAQRGCGDKCGNTCTDYNTNPICPKRPCTNDGCACKESYIYDQNLSLCVKPKDCTEPCKANERYSACLLNECVPKTCDDVGKPPACPAIAVDRCPGGCICDYGYVKDKEGNCIDAKTCPTCGDDPNAQAGCGNPCGKTCASLYANKSELICPQYCESNGCDCKEGYLLNTDVKPPRCVLVEDCPKPPSKCGNNEEFYCGPSCPDSEASCTNPNPPTCINKKCELKCFCKKSFVRDANNNCIPLNKCPINCTKPNERYIDCLAGQCSPKTCDDLGRSIPCPFIVGPCPGGCICAEGYLRDSDGNCIKLEKCPPKPCGGNQTWMSPCNAPCPYPRCPRDDKPPPPCVEIKPCYPGCQCKLNYLRNSTGHCILAPECPPVKCTGKNEIWDGCPSACLAENCDDIDRQPTTCNTLIWLCSPRCVCKKGHFRNKDGVCIPASQCPGRKCTKPNEKYIDCLAGQCKPKTCDELVRPAPCPRVKPPCPGGCICVDGYVRNKAGNCIKKEDCSPKCKGPHEKYIDCPVGQCNPKTCKDLITPPPCPRVIPPCPGGCVCEDGYLRDEKGICIKKEQCPQACKANQTYVTCNANCPDKYCPKADRPQPICDPPRECPPGCTCKINYRYDQSGNCILASECPAVKCTDPNAEWDPCPSSCLSEQCEDADSPPVVCNTLLLNCQPRCVCKKGHYKNKNGRCVPAKECPSVCKDPNASWTVCKDACPKTCQNTNPGCVNKKCSAGCQCNAGYVLSKIGGKCVKIEKCPDYANCGANQTFVHCTFKCPQVMCPKSDRVILCKPPRDCPGGCGCKPYYRYNATGDCIKASDCPPVKCTGANQVWTPCQRISDWERCEDRYNSPPINPGHPDDCTPRCVCKKGYWRNATYECVPENECHSAEPVVSVPRRCPPNEVLKSKAPCPPDTCDMLYLSVLCIANQTESVVCTCKDGYLRTNSTSTGVCVPQDRCLPPECADDPNAKRGCGNRCGKTCTDYNDTSIVCKKNVCRLFGCDCKEGFVYDSNVNRCVKPQQCTKQCTKPHERYSTCLLGECVPKTCAQLGYPIPCPGIAFPCEGGCICEDGYVRDINGDCIEKNKCPTCGGDPNAVSGCGNPCGKTCESLYQNKSELICPEYCEYNGCDCKPGYLLLNADNPDSKKCVPEKECPKPNKLCKGPHEIYIDCPAGQCNPKTCDDLVTPPGCPRIKPPCPGGCVCKSGYLRNSTGICIKKEKCPSVQCKKPNERYSNCLLGECVPKTCKDVGYPVPCPDIIGPCAGGCTCIEGFVRDCNGDCIDMKKCPCCGGDPNAVSGCGNPCGKTCASLYANKSDIVCPQYCEYNGCDCKPGFLLLESNDTESSKCVPERECPKPSVCKDPNASWTECMDACPRTCQNTKPGCVNVRCSAGCQCNSGYVLSEIGGKCVKIEECPAPKCKGPYEIYIDCPIGQCNAKTCKDLITPPPCPRVIPPCPGGCVCEDGYLRDERGICIRKEQCPSVCKDPNASWTECMDACPRTCQNTNPGCVNVRCSAGCQCNPGYVLSGTGGKCVKIEECPDYANCGANQTFVECTFKCPQVMCPESDQIILCKPPRDCPGGCGCKPYYRYNATGDCIKASDCPPVECTGANQVWTSCQRISDWERCEDRYNSPPINPGDPDDCTPKCVCKTGYWRNAAYECVPENECPP